MNPGEAELAGEDGGKAGEAGEDEVVAGTKAGPW